MDAAPFVSLIRRWWWLSLLGALMAVAAYGAVSGVRDRNAGPTEYRATVTLIVSARGASEPAPDTAITDRPWDMDRLMATYAEIITSGAVASRAALELGDSSLAGRIRDQVSVKTPGYTQILEVTARARTPEAADRLAGAIAWSANAVREERQIPGSLAIFEQTAAAPAPGDGTSPWLAILIVAAGGALGAAAMVFAYEYATNLVRDARDAETATGLRVLATIPSRGSARAVVTSLARADRVAAERFRMLRTAFGIETADDLPRTVAVTAPSDGCGATNVAANFALAVAQTGRRVALVDADLRSPAMRTALGVASEAGLSEALTGGLELDTAAMPSAPGVAFIAAGVPAENPSELLDSDRFDALLRQLRVRFDLIVFDTPPAMAFTDASVVAAKCDAAIVAVRAERTTRREATACVELLRRSGTRIVGVALTEDAGLFGAPAVATLRGLRRADSEAASP